ncbi:hypothetical protein [Mesorhizobium sp.]|uniref:hypothetical protein n=1 Tax=Mesorhizobium sp. TaxID=1871066 RepID=UPI000FE5042C|nr:hypothetical protein [Mesorhizobium sp.]RWD44072.1 MAG: hypothetical protein EOS35_18135 [Mesorhizobium sp.]
MNAEALCLHDDDFRHSFASKQFAGLLQRFPNLSEHDARGSRIRMKLSMDRRAQRIEHLPPPMRAARQPMDRFGRLDDFELAGAVRPKVILNKGTHSQINGQKAARIDTGLTQPRERNMRSVGSWLPAQVHCRVNSTGERQCPVNLLRCSRNRIDMLVMLKPARCNYSIWLEFARSIGFAPVRPVPRFNLYMISTMESCPSSSSYGSPSPATWDAARVLKPAVRGQQWKTHNSPCSTSAFSLKHPRECAILAFSSQIFPTLLKMEL